MIDILQQIANNLYDFILIFVISALVGILIYMINEIMDE